VNRPESQSIPWHQNAVWLQVSLAAWIVALVVISVMVALNPDDRTVTGLYHEASRNWLTRQPLYVGPSGMNYFPHFAILFTPFHWLPIPIGDIAWRWVGGLTLISGIWRITNNQFARGTNTILPWILLLTLPLSLSALRYGQANALFSGLLVHATASIVRQRWSSSTLWMVLAVIVKPLGFVMLLLAPFVYAPLRLRVLGGILFLLVIPFLFADFHYVWSQYLSSYINLKSCSVVVEHRFADFQGIVRTFGGELPTQVALSVRMIAAVVTLCVWILASRQFGEPLRAFWLLALTTIYLMLFNPMNESNSYVILAPAISLWALTLLATPQCQTLGWWLVAMVLSIGILKEPLRPLFGNNFALVWNPMMAISFFVVLTLLLRATRKLSLTPMSTKVLNQQ